MCFTWKGHLLGLYVRIGCLLKMLEVHSFVNSPVTSNCYVLFDKSVSNECIIVDPGSKDEKELFDYLKKEKLEPKFIIHTH